MHVVLAEYLKVGDQLQVTGRIIRAKSFRIRRSQG